MGFRPEEPGMVCHPFSDPGGTEVPVERRTAVQIFVVIRRTELGGVVRAWQFLKSSELFVLFLGLTVVGINRKLSTRIVVIGIEGKSAIDDDDGVDTAIAPIGKNLVGLGPDGRSIVEDPLAFVPRMAVDVNGFGSKADDGKSAWSASIGSH